MSERRAYWCQKCEKEGRAWRQFQLPGDPPPRCPRHGAMTRQKNAPYRAKKQL